MTLAELQRAINSKQRRRKVEAQEKATFDYILANMIGKSVGRLYSSSITLPEIGEAYPTLFDSLEIQEKKQEVLDKQSALRFKLFVDAHNSKFKDKR